MTYVSLVHQIKQANLIGYTGQKITNAVLGSMSPSLTSQTVSESTSNLCLQRLEQFLEVYFQQQNAHDLCNTMSTMLQSPEETAYYVVMRSLKIRLKILLFSEKPDDLS